MAGGPSTSRRFLETVVDSFLAGVIDEPTRGGALLDLSLANKEELIREVKADSNLGCIFQKLVDFKVLREVCKTNRRTTALDWRAVNCILVRDLLG